MVKRNGMSSLSSFVRDVGIRILRHRSFVVPTGLCLDVKTAICIDEVRAEVDKLMNELIKNPKVLDSLLEKK